MVVGSANAVEVCVGQVEYVIRHGITTDVKHD